MSDVAYSWQANQSLTHSLHSLEVHDSCVWNICLPENASKTKVENASGRARCRWSHHHCRPRARGIHKASGRSRAKQAGICKLARAPILRSSHMASSHASPAACYWILHLHALTWTTMPLSTMTRHLPSSQRLEISAAGIRLETGVRASMLSILCQG